MLDFACTDAECQCAKRAVRAGMTVAADDGHAGLSETKLRSNHMNDALLA